MRYVPVQVNVGQSDAVAAGVVVGDFIIGPRKRGKITVSLRRVGGEVEIVVEDQGPGIPSDNLAKIFDRFYTDRPGEDAFGKNSGLGLNISQQIIKVLSVIG